MPVQKVNGPVTCPLTATGAVPLINGRRIAQIGNAFQYVFDIETAFFYPLAVKFQAAPQYLFAQAVLFVLILAVGYIYILRKGVLNWK